jgi:DNA-binding transcriptional regulator YiaG
MNTTDTTEDTTTTTPPKPTPVEVREAREAAGLTQREAAELVYLGHAKRWSEIERGVQTMHAAVWELFCIKIEPLVRAAAKVQA